MNALRTVLTVVALLLDALCVALLAAVFFLAHPTPSAILGLAILGFVIVANAPALVMGLAQARRDARPDTAGVFD